MTYAIVLDLDSEILKQAYPNPSWHNAYSDIRNVFERLVFYKQGNIYFGGESVNGVGCVLAAQTLSTELPWFKAAIRDMRMLRIEEICALEPVL